MMKHHCLSLRFVFQLCGLVFFFHATWAAGAESSQLEAWRNAVSAVRLLAENDVPRAHKEATRLWATLPADAGSADKVRILNLTARIEQYLAQKDEALKHAQQALEIARQDNDRIGQAEAWLNIALDPDRQASDSIGDEASSRALELLQNSSRPDLVGEAMLREAVRRWRLGLFESSVTLCIQAMDIASRNHDPLALLYAHHGLAITNNLTNRHAEAREQFRQMGTLAQALHMKHQEAYAMLGMANNPASPQDARSATRLIRQAIRTYREVGAPLSLAQGLYALAGNLSRQGLQGEALQTLDEVLAIYKSHPTRLGLWWAMSAHSEMLQEMGRLVEARAEAERAQKLAEEIGLPLQLGGSAQRMAALAEAMGDHKRAYEFARKAIEQAVNLRNDKSRILVASLVQRYQEDSKLREIEELNHRNEIEKARRGQVEAILGGIVLLLAATSYFLFRLRRVNRELAQSREHVRLVNQGLEEQVLEKTAHLHASEEKLRSMYELSPVGFALTDMQGRYIEFNEAFRAICGYPADELLKLDYWELTPREYEEQEAAQLESLERTGRYGPYEKEYVQKDGRRIAIRMNGMLVEGHNGQGHIWSIVEDISERKRLDEVLRFIAQGEWLRSGGDFLSALANYFGKTLDVDYVVIDRLGDDPAYAETVALYACGEIVPNMRYALQHTPCENVMTGNLCCYPSGVQRQFPLDSLLVDMQVESYAGTPLRDEEGKVVGLIAVMDGKPMADVSRIFSMLQLVAPSAAAELKRSQMENTLRESRDALAEAQRIAQVGSWELDLMSGELEWSDEIYRIFEIDPQQFGASYQAFLDAIHPDDRDMVNEAYTASLESRTAYCIDHRLLFADGRVKHVRECCETQYDADGKPLRSTGTVQDITNVKNLEIELRQQAGFQQSLLNALNEVGMQLMVVEEGKITYVSNRKLARSFGYMDEDGGVGTPLLDIIHPDDRARVMDYYMRRMEGDESVPSSYELGLVTKGGERREYETSVAVVSGSGALRLITVGKDITERKRLERELQQRESEFRTLAENAPDPIFRYDREGRRIYVNAAGVRLSGKTREELLGSTPLGAQLLPSDDAGKLVRGIAQVVETGRPSENEVKFIAPDGREFLFFNRYVPEFGADGKVESVLSMSMDITERKRTEAELAAHRERLEELVQQRTKELLESEALLGALVDNLPFEFFAMDTSLAYTMQNAVSIRNYGRVVGKRIEELGLPEEVLSKWMEQNRAVLAGETQYSEYEKNIAGEARVYESLVAPVWAGGEVIGVVGVGMDITERKRAEAQVRELNAELEQRVLFRTLQLEEANRDLRESELRFRGLAENSPDVIIRYDREGRRLYANQAISDLARQSAETLVGKSPAEGTVLLPDSAERLIRSVHSVFAVGKSERIELAAAYCDEAKHEYDAVLVPEYGSGGNVETVLLLARDITERKKAEAALLSSEALARSRSNLLNAIVESSPEIIVFALDVNYRYLAFNSRHKETMRAIWGVEIETGMNMLDMIGSHSDREVAQRGFDRALSGESLVEESTYGDEALLREYWQSFYSPIRSESGEVIGLTCFVLNISSRRRVEISLAEREREFRTLAENLPVAVIRYDAECRRSYLNPTAERMLRGSAAELIGHHPGGSTVPALPAMIEHYRGQMEQVLSGGATRELEFVLDALPLEQQEYYEVRFMPEYGGGKHPRSVLAIWYDITVRKRLEQALARREHDFRTLANNMPDNVVRWDAEGRYLYINPTHERTLGKSCDEVLGTFIPDSHEAVKATFWRVAANGEAVHAVRQSVVVNGIEELHDVSMVPEFDESGRVVSVLGLGRNMTDIYRMQEAVAQREQEFRNLAESSPDSIIRYDLQHRIRYLNTQLVRVLGLSSADEVIGKRPIEVWPDGRFIAIDEAAQRAIASGKVETTELMMELDGAVRFGHIYVVPERDVNGNITGTIAVGRDITDIREVERRLRHFIDNLPGLAYTFRLMPDGHASFPYVSAAIEEIYGIQPEEVADNFAPIHNLAHPDDKPRIEAAIAESARELTPFRLETRVCRPGCPERWLDVRSVPEPQPDGSILWYGMMLDITERKAIEIALQGSEKMLNEAQRIAHVGSWDVDIKNDKLVWSDEIFRIWEIDKTQFKADFAAFLETVHPEDRERVVQAYNQAIADHAPYEVEHRLWFPDGRVKYILEQGEPQYDAQGEPVRFIGTSLDITERKRMEDQLAKERATLRTFFGALPDLAWMKDVEGRYLACNPMFEGFFGATEADILGRTDFDFVDAEQALFFRQKDKEAEAVGKPCVNEEWVTFASDGRLGLLETVKSPVFDAGGKIVGVIGIGRDITLRKQAEDALRRSEQLMRTVVDATPDWIFIKDREHRYQLVNKGYADALHLVPEDFIGKNDLDLGFPEELVKGNPDKGIRGFWVDDQLVLESNETQVYPDDPATIDGEVHTFHTIKVPLRDASGKAWGVLAFARDITDRKLLEAGLRESRNFLRKIMDGISDPIFVKDRQHVWIEFNQAFCDLLGQPREALLGKSDYDFLSKEQADVFWEKDEEVFDFGAASVNEESITGADGVERFIQTKKEPVVLEEGREPLLVGVIRDITGRRQMELAREVALSEAVRLGQLRSAFMAQMSHELRTPLNGILGYAQNLLLDGNLNDKQRSSLTIIQHSGDHLLGLLNDVLDHAKIEADKLELNFGEVRMEALLRGVAELMTARAEQKKLEFMCSLEGDIPSSIRSDGQRLRQVLLNLLSNAVKFTEQGQIHLRVSMAAPERMRFEVGDTGIGIPDNKLESIFIPFEQAGDGRRTGGTGLGLAISRKLVQLMGGDIRVQSQPGKGSVFSFEIAIEIMRPDALDAVAVQAVAVPAIEQEILFAPPRQELETLYGLAKRGNMRSIAQHAVALARQDERYEAFAGQLEALANSYQSKAILQLIERFMENGAG